MTDSINFTHEINFKKINISCINYSDNHQFCSINYNKEPFYLQTPTFNFFQPIIEQQVGKNKYNELYLFFNKKDKGSMSFITFIGRMEDAISKHLISISHKKLELSPIIKTLCMENNTKIKYIKLKLINNSQFYHNKTKVTIEQFNQLINITTIQLIIEINMIWLTDSKFGLYLKPLKIKAIDTEPNVEFREPELEIVLSEDKKNNEKTLIETLSKKCDDDIKQLSSDKLSLDDNSESIKIENMSRKRKSQKLVVSKKEDSSEESDDNISNAVDSDESLKIDLKKN